MLLTTFNNFPSDIMPPARCMLAGFPLNSSFIFCVCFPLNAPLHDIILDIKKYGVVWSFFFSLGRKSTEERSWSPYLIMLWWSRTCEGLTLFTPTAVSARELLLPFFLIVEQHQKENKKCQQFIQRENNILRDKQHVEHENCQML